MKQQFKTIIAGSRDFNDAKLADHILSDTLDFTISEVVSGTARGADLIGEEWAKARGIPIKRFPAAWDIHGKSAGYIRNAEMADYAEACVVFWKNESRGSGHMIKLAKKKNLRLVVVPC